MRESVQWSPVGSPRGEPTDRIVTLPNALSALRLVGVPFFLWLVLTERDGWAIAVLMVSGTTDWLDGKIARRWNQMSRIGALLDPAADRLYILATLVGLTARDVIPLCSRWPSSAATRSSRPCCPHYFKGRAIKNLSHCFSNFYLHRFFRRICLAFAKDETDIFAKGRTERSIVSHSLNLYDHR